MRDNKFCISIKIVYLFIALFFLTFFIISANYVVSSNKITSSRANEIAKLNTKSQLNTPNGIVKKGTLNIYTVIVDFENNVNVETIDSIKKKYESVQSYFTLTTSGKFTVDSKIVRTTKLNEESIKEGYLDCTSQDHVKRWLSNIKKQTLDLDENKDSYSLFVFSFPWVDKCSTFTFDAVTPGVRDHIFMSGPEKYEIYAHEISHYTTLGHASFLFCNGVTIPTSATACSIQLGDDPFNIMGRHFPGQFNGVMKQQNRWLSSNIKTFKKYLWQKKAQKDFTLNAIEMDSKKTQVVKIPKSNSFYGDAYYIEYRYPMLYDDTTPLPPSGGVIIYMKDIREGARDDTLLMDVHPQPQFGFDSIKNARLITGEIFDDTINKIKITVTSIDTNAKTATVLIELY